MPSCQVRVNRSSSTCLYVTTNSCSLASSTIISRSSPPRLRTSSRVCVQRCAYSWRLTLSLYPDPLPSHGRHQHGRISIRVLLPDRRGFLAHEGPCLYVYSNALSFKHDASYLGNVEWRKRFAKGVSFTPSLTAAHSATILHKVTKLSPSRTKRQAARLQHTIAPEIARPSLAQLAKSATTCRTPPMNGV